MSSLRRNPAIYAGLLGSGMWALPTPALASPLDVLMSEPYADYVEFGLGFVAGTTLACAVTLITHLVRRRKHDCDDDEREHARHGGSHDDKGPKGTKGPSEQHGAHARPKHQRSVDAAAPSKAQDGERSRKPRHMADMIVSDEDAKDGKAQRAVRAKAPAGRSSAPKHARALDATGPVAVREPAARKEAEEKSQEPAAQAPTKRTAKEHASETPRTSKKQARAATQTAQAPKAEPKAKEDAAAKASQQEAAEATERHAKHRHSLRERVSNVLAERLGKDMLEDLPVIKRADGTVADVGTGWWNDALGSSIRNVNDIDSGIIAEGDEGASQVESVPIVTATGIMDRTRPSDGELRSHYISQSVAEVEQGLFPEHRTAEDLEEEDLWETALKAMGETLGRGQMPVFIDAVGGADTLDEPTGIDEATQPTGFIPFRRPAGHPEVVDNSSFVDYLIDDEFSKNPSDLARETSRDYLRLIQGGSQKSRPVPAQGTRQKYAPRHMAPKEGDRLAKEA